MQTNAPRSLAGINQKSGAHLKSEKKSSRGHFVAGSGCSSHVDVLSEEPCPSHWYWKYRWLSCFLRKYLNKYLSVNTVGCVFFFFLQRSWLRLCAVVGQGCVGVMEGFQAPCSPRSRKQRKQQNWFAIRKCDFDGSSVFPSQNALLFAKLL